MRRTPLNKLWAQPTKAAKPKPAPEPKPVGDLETNPLIAMQAVVGQSAVQPLPDEELVVVVDDPKPEPVRPVQPVRPAAVAPAVARRAVYTEGRFKVARLSGRIAQIVPAISLHNYRPDW